MHEAIFALGRAWAADMARPRVGDATLRRWDDLLEAWIADTSLPLLIRKARGDRRIRHASSTGRHLVPVDNSPAQWAFAVSFDGICPAPTDIERMLREGQIPIAMAFTREERVGAIYHGLRGNCPSTNAAGWKLAHLDDVALDGRGGVSTYSEAALEAHFRRLMSPRNMFVVPLDWGGLAEVSDFVEGFRAGGGLAEAR